MVLHAGASFGARVLQKYRRSSRKLVLQPPPPEYTSTVRRCHPWRIRNHHRITRFPQLSSQTSCPRLILVDSTRAGKRLPDALSKTVPMVRRRQSRYKPASARLRRYRSIVTVVIGRRGSGYGS